MPQRHLNRIFIFICFTRTRGKCCVPSCENVRVYAVSLSARMRIHTRAYAYTHVCACANIHAIHMHARVSACITCMDIQNTSRPPPTPTCYDGISLSKASTEWQTAKYIKHEHTPHNTTCYHGISRSNSSKARTAWQTANSVLVKQVKHVVRLS